MKGSRFKTREDKMNKDPMDRIRQLERRHVQVHSQLLQALDELYLTKEDRQSFVLSKEQEAQLKDRHAMQMSLEKSVAISKAMQRGLQFEQDQDDELSENEVEKTTARAMAANRNSILNSTSEDKLAIKLNQLNTDNYALDGVLAKKLDKLKPLCEEYNSRRQEFDRLTSELAEMTSKLPIQETESDNNNDDNGTEINNTALTDRDTELERENTILFELTTALTHLSRNPRG